MEKETWVYSNKELNGTIVGWLAGKPVFGIGKAQNRLEPNKFDKTGQTLIKDYFNAHAGRELKPEDYKKIVIKPRESK